MLERTARVLFRIAARTHPVWIREAVGDEMVEAFVEGLRHHRGTGARVAYTVRSVADALGSGLRERRRGDPSHAGIPRRGGGRMTNGGGWTDLRVALRSLRRTPGFTLAAASILALGIGANTALFSALRGALLTPPPFPEPDRIVLLDLTDSSTVNPDRFGSMPWSYPKWKVLEAADDLPLSAAAAYASRNVSLTGAGDAVMLPAEVATPAYLEVLGVSPSLGRGFGAEDDVEGAALVTILSHATWVDRFGADPGIVGRDVVLNGRPVTVIGVLPPGFVGLTGHARLWITPHAASQLLSSFMVRGAQAHWLQGVGRLAPDATIEGLRDRMQAVGLAAEAVAPDPDPTVVRGGSARGLMDVRVGERQRQSLVVLLVASALLLVAACANLGGLLMARATARRRESAVRAALGAGRWRVARGLLTESLVLAVLGGAASVLVAWGASSWLVGAWPSRSLSSAWNVDVVQVGAAGLDPWALGFAGVLSVLVGLALGAVPAWTSGRAHVADHLKDGRVGRSGGARRGRGLLVAGEIAVALVLVVGAGLLLRSLQELQRVERGYTPGRLLTFDLPAPRGSAWSDDPTAFHAEVEAALDALPEVERSGMGCVAPVSGHCMITAVRRADDRTWPDGSRPGIGVHYVSDDWFRALGIPVLRGRTFESGDRRDSPPVVVLSETAARELFPDGDALGGRVGMGVSLTPSEGDATAEVVGVVADVLYDRPENGLMAEAYISHRQEDSYGTFVVRTRGEPLAAVPAIRAAIRAIEPDAPLLSLRTVADAEAAATADTRLLGSLLGAFAGLALLLACTGVWAAVAFTVSRRTREFGLRMALGARPAQVVAPVVRSGVGLALGGVALGVLAAAWGSRLLASLLFGVGTADPLAFVGGATVLLSVAVLAAWLPARRATRVDPVDSLRAE